MDNDREVGQTAGQNPFLPDEIADPEQESVVRYSLEEEYAKTAANRQIRIYGIVVSFAILMVAIAAYFYYSRQEELAHVTVTIDDFEDAHLQEISLSISAIESQLKLRSAELEDLEYEYGIEKESILSEYEREAMGIEAVKLPEELRDEKHASLQALRNSKLTDLNQAYETPMREKNVEIEMLQGTLAEYATQLAEKGDKARILTSGMDKLYELRVQRLTDRYRAQVRDLRREHAKKIDKLILTYNPNYRKEHLLSIVAPPADIIEGTEILPPEVLSVITSEKLAETESLESLQETYKALNLLTERMAQIPFRNSMQRSVLHVDSLQKKVIDSLNALLIDVSVALETRSRFLDGHGYAVESMFREEGIMGYVLDQRNLPEVLVYLRSDTSIGDGDTGYIYGDDYSVQVRFEKRGDMVYATPLTTAEGNLIRPFDRIYVSPPREEHTTDN